MFNQPKIRKQIRNTVPLKKEVSMSPEDLEQKWDAIRNHPMKYRNDDLAFTGFTGYVDDGFRCFLKPKPEEDDESMKIYGWAEDRIRYGGLYGPPQSQKTNSFCRLTELSLLRGHHVLCTSTGLNEQRYQNEERVSKYLANLKSKKRLPPYHIFHINSSQLKQHLKEVEKASKEGELCVLFTIETAANVEVAGRLFEEINKNTTYKQVVWVHDEADTLNHEEPTLENGRVQVQREWKKTVRIVTEQCHFLLRRMFVSATLENCLYYFPIHQPICLPIPPTYVGWKDFVYHPYNCKNVDSAVDKAFIEYMSMRTDKSNGQQGILLVATKQQTKDQRKMLVGLAHRLPKDAVVCIHNGHGLTVHLHPDFLDRDHGQDYSVFPKRVGEFLDNKESAKTREIMSRDNIDSSNIFVLKNIRIYDVYEILRSMGVKGVITIAYILMNRGITHVSNSPRNDPSIHPLVAIKMIAHTSSTFSAVELVQMMSRPAGCAGHGVQRHIYAPQDMIASFQGLMRSQERNLPQLSLSLNTKNTLKNENIGLKLDYFPRSIEKKKLIGMNEYQKLNTIQNIEKKPKKQSLPKGEIGEIDEEKLKEMWKEMQRTPVELKSVKNMHIHILKALWEKECSVKSSMNIMELGKKIGYKSFRSLPEEISEEDRKSFLSNLRNGGKSSQHAKKIGNKVELWHLSTSKDSVKMNYTFAHYFNRFRIEEDTT